MLDKHIQQIINETPIDKSPIFYGSLKYFIIKNKKQYSFIATKIVMKGTREEILKNPETKKRALLKYFGDDKAAKKKALDFDLSKIQLSSVLIKKFLGYGVK